MWPDCAIFNSSWQHIFLSKQPKCCVTFGAILKYVTFKGKLLWLQFGQLLLAVLNFWRPLYQRKICKWTSLDLKFDNDLFTATSPLETLLWGRRKQCSSCCCCCSHHQNNNCCNIPLGHSFPKLELNTVYYKQQSRFRLALGRERENSYRKKKKIGVVIDRKIEIERINRNKKE